MQNVALEGEAQVNRLYGSVGIVEAQDDVVDVYLDRPDIVVEHWKDQIPLFFAAAKDHGPTVQRPLERVRAGLKGLAPLAGAAQPKRAKIVV